MFLKNKIQILNKTFGVTLLFQLEERKIFSSDDPFELFRRWKNEAKVLELNDPDAIALATVDQKGFPNVRMVLLRYIEDDGFVFFTNYESAKGQEIKDSGKIAFVCHWKSIRRQIRVRGLISKDETRLSEEYFNKRPLESRIGAWASKQSTVIPNKAVLLDKINKLRDQLGENPPKPLFWGGFRIKPLEIEFWSDGAYRVHDRFLWKRSQVDAEWKINRLSP